jgi:hypothetical protein
MEELQVNDQLCGETRIDSTHPCVRSVISSCVRELVEVVRVRILDALRIVINDCVLNFECNKVPL